MGLTGVRSLFISVQHGVLDEYIAYHKNMSEYFSSLKAGRDFTLEDDCKFYSLESFDQPNIFYLRLVNA